MHTYVLGRTSFVDGAVVSNIVYRTQDGGIRRGYWTAMVTIRGYGFKGVGLSVRVAHELKKSESRFVYEMTFDTFEASDPETNRPITSVQIIIMPPV